MLSTSWRTLSKIVCLLLVAGAATLGSAQSINNATAQPGDIICLAPVQVSAIQALWITGNAFVPNNPNQPVVVKWLAFDNDTGIRLLKVVDSQINQPVGGNGDHLYACINNNSGITVTFNLSQMVQ